MSTTELTPPKQTKTRSPAYPAFSLATAIEQARKLWQSQRKQEAHVDSALKSLGYASRSGPALRTMAALGHYGLIDESGKGDERKVRLSEAAQDILHLEESDVRRQKTLREAALKPPIYASLWERYGANLPDDAAIRPFLIREKSYNDEIVTNLLANYRATLEFAKCDKSDEAVTHEEKSSRDDRPPQDRKPASKGSEKAMTLDQELPVLVGNNRVARIPFPMTEDDFDLLIGTLTLWKKKLLTVNQPTQDAKSETANADQSEV